MLPTQGSEEKLGGLAVGVDRACSELDMQVTAFQGEVTGAVRQTVVFASAAGTGKLPLSQKKRVQADCSVPKSLKKGDVHREIVQCGYAGLEGTLRILGESRQLRRLWNNITGNCCPTIPDIRLSGARRNC